jgi:hypothetical protein
VTFAGALACSTLVFGASAQDENAKWFVLRQETTNACRAAQLISVNGEYAHASANIASKPYDTESEALARQKELERTGSCVKAS